MTEKLTDAKLFIKARKACKTYREAKELFEMSCSSPFGYNEANGSERLRLAYEEADNAYFMLNSELSSRLGYGDGGFTVYLNNSKWPNLKQFLEWL